MTRAFAVSLRALAVLTVLCGVIYPAVVTGIAGVLLPGPAGGSLIVRDGTVIGSRLVAQPFTSPRYFHPRPSASNHHAMASGGSNLGPTNPDLRRAVGERMAAVLAEDPSNIDPVPVDLVTASGSGLDPHITPAAAFRQASRVARARGLPEPKVRELVLRSVEGRTLGVLGEPRVNVLELNLALDGLR